MTLPWLVILSFVGASGAPVRADPAPPSRPTELGPVQMGRPTVLILRKDTPNMDTFVAGMIGELQSDFNLLSLEVGKETTVDELGLGLTRAAPAVVVLLDNPTAELYRQYQEAHPGAIFPPSVIAMALFVEQTAARIQNATGIAYEVPAVTSLVRLRTTIKSPVIRVGVVHRPTFGKFVADQARLASIEGIEIVPYEVKQRPTVGQLRAGLRTLDKLGIDALWILNDNVLLTSEMLVVGWLPAMRRNERPVVVGVSNLLRTDPPVGSFAVLPDHQSLGMQAAELIYELRDTGWVVARNPAQLPIAVETVLNRPLMERTVGLQDGAIDQIDEIIE